MLNSQIIKRQAVARPRSRRAKPSRRPSTCLCCRCGSRLWRGFRSARRFGISGHRTSMVVTPLTQLPCGACSLVSEGNRITGLNVMPQTITHHSQFEQKLLERPPKFTANPLRPSIRHLSVTRRTTSSRVMQPKSPSQRLDYLQTRPMDFGHPFFCGPHVSAILSASIPPASYSLS
jgi:hypothetical protein